MAAIENQPEEIRKGVQDLEKEITCPICHDLFQEPKILPCCHYYCKGCVQKLAWRAGANQPFACPECRSDTFLPENDPDRLPTAFFVNRMIELHSKMEKAHGKGEALCEECEEYKAVAFCRQCTEFICDNCVKVHKRMRLFSEHKVVMIEELKKGGAKQILINIAPPPKCKVHGEPVKIYCYECKHLICRDCVIDDHAGHKYEFVKKAAPAIKQKVAERLISLKVVHVNLCDADKSVKSTKSDIESQGASAVDKIEQSFQQLHDLLEQRKREMLEEASSLVKGKLDALSVQEKGIDMASGTIQSLVDFVERNIENATDEELMEVHAQLLNRIDEETKKHQQSSGELEPVEEADIVVEVRCAEELRKLCREQAIVMKLPVDPAKSTVQGDGFKSAEINKLSKVTLHTKSPKGKPHRKPVVVRAKLTTISNGSVVEANVKQGRGTYEIEYTPCVRGRHQLEVTVNGLPVAGSPFPVFVKIPPTHLGKAVKSYPGLLGFGIAVNSKDELVFAERYGDILILDRNGKCLHKIKKSQHGFDGLHGVAVDDNDNIYVTDSNSQNVYKFDKNGTQIKVVKPAVKDPDLRGIAVSGDQVIIVDEANHQLLCFTRDLEFVKTTDIHGGRPVGVACDEEGKMYVCDFEQGCVIAPGELMYTFGDNDTSHKLSQPHSICVDGDFVYVSEWENNHCVSVFTKQGNFITSFGKKGSGDGQFIYPTGIAIDSDGVLYVCDYSNSRIQVF